MKRIKRPPSWLEKRARRGFRGYPIGTVAFYGPTADLATKVVVSVFKEKGSEPDPLVRWFSVGTDIRRDSIVGDKISAFLRLHEVRSVVVADKIIGCPHEEGIDYPDGTSCPQCPYWADRDRFTHERIQ